MQLGAEFVGTFILVFSAAGGPIVNQKYHGAESLIGNAACAGLPVMAMVFSTGHISGAHFNPSVTIALAAVRQFPWIQVPGYLVVQVSASICAAFTLKGVFHPFMSGGVTVPAVSIGQAFALEFIITFTLLFVITAVATDKCAVCILLISYYGKLYLHFLKNYNYNVNIICFNPFLFHPLLIKMPPFLFFF